MSHAMMTLNDGRAMPQLGLGIWQMPEQDTAAVVAQAIGLGYRLIDGAAIYGNEVGLGQGVRQSGVPRDQVFVTSKVWNTNQGHAASIRAVGESLARTGLDYLDLCLIHWPTPARGLYLETWRALIGLREQGLVRSIGVSNFMPEHLDHIIAETGVVPVVNQIERHPHLQQATLMAAHAKHGIITQSWTPLGQGRSFDSAPVKAVMARTGCTAAQAVIRWHMQSGCSVIPKSVNPARLAENLDVAGFDLTPAEMAAMATIDAGTRLGPDPMVFA